jgi:hypothetical protein
MEDRREILVRADEGNFVRYRASDGTEFLRGTETLLPRQFVACFPDDRRGPELHLRFEMCAGVPYCREVALRSVPGGREIRQADVRAAEIEQYLEIACQMVALPVTEKLDSGGVIATQVTSPAGLAAVARSVSRARRNTRRQIADDKLPEVAEVYRANPDRPTAAVAERFGIALRTASLYVRRARNAGLLKEAQHGKHR